MYSREREIEDKHKVSEMKQALTCIELYFNSVIEMKYICT